MTSQTFNEPNATLTGIVQKWERRWRWQRTLYWLPRAVIPALLIGIGLALIARVRPFLLPSQIALITLISLAAGIGVCAALIWLKRRSPVEAARQFDVQMGLDERVSTALELIGGVIVSNAELTALQIDDAQEHARAVHASDHLPLRSSGREWGLIVVLGIILALLLLLPNAYSEAALQDAVVADAINEAEETIEDILPNVAADPNLDEEEREMLLETLEQTDETLSQEGVTPEEAIASLSETENALNNLSELFDQRVNQAQAAASTASEALREMSEAQTSEQNDALQQLVEQLQQMSQQTPNMMPSQQQAAASAMQQAGQMLQNSGDQNLQQAGQNLQQAGEQLQNGNTQAASEQLNEASQNAQQAQSEASQNQQSSEQMSQQAQQTNNAAEQVSQAAQDQQQQGDQSQNNQQQGAASQSDQANQQPGQSDQPGDNQDQGQTSSSNQGGNPQMSQQDSSSQSASEQQGGSQSSAASQQEAQMAGQTGDGSSQLEGAALPPQGGGAGDGTTDSASPNSAQSSTSNTAAGNNPDGEGERNYEPIYSPNSIGGEPGEDQLFLEPEDGNSPVVEGEFAQNPTGNSVIPYDQVFSSYANAANQALESGYVPLGLRDVIRNYFTALAPAGGETIP